MQENRKQLCCAAKQYVEEIYVNHRQDDLTTWNHLIDILFDYVNLSVSCHEQEHHN